MYNNLERATAMLKDLPKSALKGGDIEESLDYIFNGKLPMSHNAEYQAIFNNGVFS